MILIQNQSGTHDSVGRSPRLTWNDVSAIRDTGARSLALALA